MPSQAEKQAGRAIPDAPRVTSLSRADQPLACAKRLATSSQLTTFHQASM
jgi:hypothetical protein